MGDQSTEKPSSEHLRAAPHRRSVIMATLLFLDALVFGGCIALLLVNWLLNSLLDVYVAAQSMAAASAILDFMDDLLPVYLTYGVTLLILVLGTASVWTWRVTRSRLLRYGVILLCLVVLVVLAGVWLFGGLGVPMTPPMTPTPTMGSVILAVGSIL
jgi:hypothetical protein